MHGSGLMFSVGVGRYVVRQDSGAGKDLASIC